MRRLRFLVTGANGFLGTALVRRLVSSGASVTALVANVDPTRGLFDGTPPLASRLDRVVLGDIRDLSAMRVLLAQAEPDILFHLAALSQVTEVRDVPLEAMTVNAIGTATILEAVRLSRTKPQVIVCTSDKVYGFLLPREGPATEETRLRPSHPYEASKAAADIIADSFSTYYRIDVDVARMANIYGPGDRNWKRLIPGTLRSFWLGEPTIIRSDGKKVREYIYIEDAVEALMALARPRPDRTARIGSNPWNFGSGAPMSVLEVWQACVTAMKGLNIECEAPVIAGTATDEADWLALNSGKASRLLNWTAKWTMEDGMRETAEWIGTEAIRWQI